MSGAILRKGEIFSTELVIQTFLIEISGADLFVQAHSCKMKKIVGIKSSFQGRNR